MILRKFDMKSFFRIKNLRLILLLLIVVFSLVWYISSWFMLTNYSRRFNLEDLALIDFLGSRNLTYYLNDVQILIQPLPCSKNIKQVVILVASTPDNLVLRHAVRRTWGKWLPTYFVLGVSANYAGDQLIDNQNEAQEFDDMIVYDFLDHRQTQSIKTALMMDWTLHNCATAQFMMKVNEDVLINPRALKKILKENQDADLIGHKENIILVNRNKRYKWYRPYSMKLVPQFLHSCGYLIKSKHLKAILDKAKEVPIINIENIYFTFIVAFRRLGLTLRHDWRISPKKPWLNIESAYRDRALTHGYTAMEMGPAWWKIRRAQRENGASGIIRWLFSTELFFY